MRVVTAGISLALLLPSLPSAQTTTDGSRPSFEVASIKRSASLDTGGTLRMQPGGTLRSVNVSIGSIIAGAYRTADRPLFQSQIVGGPGWLVTDRYDIIAKVTDDLATLTQADLLSKLPLLMQSLLEDRLKLRVHREARQLAVYVLRIVSRDGRLGPHLRRSSVDCEAEPRTCSFRVLPGHLGGVTTLETLTSMLSAPVERVIVDRTGLTGRFEFDLEWSPDQSVTDKPSIFAAVQEQLGLRLESTRGTVEVVVIDHVERPTSD